MVKHKKSKFSALFISMPLFEKVKNRIKDTSFPFLVLPSLNRRKPKKILKGE